MLTLILPFVAVILAVNLIHLPAARKALAWISSALAGPLRIYFDSAYLANAPIVHLPPEADGQYLGVPPAVLSGFDTRTAELETLGFTRLGLWKGAEGDNIATTYFAIAAHSGTATAAIISRFATASGLGPVTLSFVSFRKGGWWHSSICAEAPPPGQVPPHNTYCFPSLASPTLLLRAHEASVEKFSPGPPGTLPADLAEWTGLLQRMRQQDLERYIASGSMKRQPPPLAARITIIGAVTMTYGSIWPLRKIRAQEALERQHATLQQLGLLELLSQAEARPMVDAQAQAIEASAGVTLAVDDRGIPRAALPTLSMLQTGPDVDPRVRALVISATTARAAGRPNAGAHVGFGIGFVVIIIIAGSLMPTVPMIIPLMLIAGVVILVAASTATGGTQTVEAGRARLLARGLCASCAYHLNNLPTEADGCITCPECGASWRRDRIVELLERGTPSPDGRPGMPKGAPPAGDDTVDDRGIRRNTVSPSLGMERYVAGPLALERLNRAAEALSREGRGPRISLAVLIGSVIFVLIAALIARSTGSVTSIMTIILLSVSYGLGIKQILRGNIGRPATVTTPIMLTERLCPCCATPLDNRPIEPDGCTVCSCGAAWKLGPKPHITPAARSGRPW
jgi:hypothetical protein